VIRDESTRDNPSRGGEEAGAGDEARRAREAYESAKQAETEARRALAEASRALKEAAEKAGIAAREIGREVSAGAEEAFEDLRGAARIAGERARDATAEALGWAKQQVEAGRPGPTGGPEQAATPTGETRPAGGPAGAPGASGAPGAVDANLSAALAYIGWALTGILFYLLGPRDRFVRFHALQSILLTAAFVIVGTVLSVVPFIGPLLFALASLGFVFVWLLVMWKALRYEEYRLPFIGEIARTQIDRRG
jgi:uncharacterized membrane protein